MVNWADALTTPQICHSCMPPQSPPQEDRGHARYTVYFTATLRAYLVIGVVEVTYIQGDARLQRAASTPRLLPRILAFSHIYCVSKPDMALSDAVHVQRSISGLAFSPRSTVFAPAVPTPTP